MWQRIQTLYLAISAVLVAVLLSGDAYIPDGGGILLGLVAAMIAVALVAFKVRILQMRLSVLSGLVALGAQGWLAFLYFSMQEVTFNWTVIFPLVIAISNFLAARGCYQDQLMVETAYRIRESRRTRRKK